MEPVIAVCVVTGALAGPVVHHVADRLAQHHPVRPVVYRFPRTVEAVAVVVATAVTFGALAAELGARLVLVPFLVLALALVTVSVVDLKVFRIPDRVTGPAFVVSLVLIVVVSLREDAPRAIGYAVVGSVAYFAVLFLAHVVYPKGMGFGDVKLAAVMGLYLGWLAVDWPSAVYLVVVALLIGSILGVVLGLALRAGLHTAFPFGPALAVGTVAVVLLADTLLRSYVV